jgi:hypothetical protein
MGSLDLMVSLYGELADGELGICPRADHVGPLTRGSMFAALIGDFAERSRRPRPERQR